MRNLGTYQDALAQAVYAKQANHFDTALGMRVELSTNLFFMRIMPPLRFHLGVFIWIFWLCDSDDKHDLIV